MADQGKWFKLWCSAADDPDLSNLSDEDFGRWCRMGIYLKKHGTDGTVVFPKPARALCSAMHTESLDTALSILRSFPNCITVSTETNITVTFRNWLKYQGDYSTDRVRKFRDMKRPKRRREEKRREENINPPVAPQGGAMVWFERFYAAYPKKRARGDAEKAWRQISPDEELLCKMLVAVESQRKSFDWVKKGGQFIPLPATWLRQKRWQDQEQETLVPVAPKAKYCASCGYTLTVHTLKQQGRTEMHGLGSLEKVCGQFQATDADLPGNL